MVTTSSLSFNLGVPNPWSMDHYQSMQAAGEGGKLHLCKWRACVWNYLPPPLPPLLVHGAGKVGDIALDNSRFCFSESKTLNLHFFGMCFSLPRQELQGIISYRLSFQEQADVYRIVPGLYASILSILHFKWQPISKLYGLIYFWKPLVCRFL